MLQELHLTEITTTTTKIWEIALEKVGSVPEEYTKWKASEWLWNHSSLENVLILEGSNSTNKNNFFFF